jgi:hypothetical protein
MIVQYRSSAKKKQQEATGQGRRINLLAAKESAYNIYLKELLVICI